MTSTTNMTCGKILLSFCWHILYAETTLKLQPREQESQGQRHLQTPQQTTHTEIDLLLQEEQMPMPGERHIAELEP